MCAEDELPTTDMRPLAIIVNTDTSTEDGTHWCAIYLHQNNRGEFFDSYGRSPDKPVIAYLNAHARNGWLYNTNVLQNIWSTVCGAYCVQYLEARNQQRNLPYSTLLRRLFPYTDSDKNDRLVQERMKEHYGLEIPLVEYQFMRSRIRNNSVRLWKKIGRNATRDKSSENKELNLNVTNGIEYE